MKMLATFLARVSPASTSAKPACMKMTSTAATSTQMLSSVACTASAVTSSWANAGVDIARASPPSAPPVMALRNMNRLLL